MPADNAPTSIDDRPPIRFHRLPRRAAAQTPSLQRDVLILFVLPTLFFPVVFVITDPAAVAYTATDPDLWGIYLSQFGHRSWGHLTGNLAGFLLIGGFEYLLFTAAGCRTYYLAVFGSALLVVPICRHFFLQFVLFYQPVFHTYEAVGFSATVAALVAALPLALTTYCTSVSDFRLPFLTALLLYAGSIAWAITRLFGADASTFVVAAFGLIGLVVLGCHVVRTQALPKGARGGYALTVGTTLSAFSLMLFALFPGTDTSTMIGHLAGYLPGFFVPFAAFWGLPIVVPTHDDALVA